jgi:hypothetical protein
VRASAKPLRDQPAKRDQQQSCRTSKEPADPRDKRGQEQVKSCEQARSCFGTSWRGETSSRAAGRARDKRFRVTSAREDGPVISGDEQGARVSRASRTGGARSV